MLIVHEVAPAAQGSAAAAAQWLTLETVFTAAGATTVVITVTSVLHGLAPKLPAKWFALVLSFALTLLSIDAHGEAYTGLNVFLAVINGFVTYAAAVGVNNVMTSAPGGATGAPAAPGRRSFRWWP